jgi:hypothetical protein
MYYFTCMSEKIHTHDIIIKESYDTHNVEMYGQVHGNVFKNGKKR